VHWTDIARRQAGVVTRQQLLGAGLASGQIQGLLARGRFDLTGWSGVYLVSGAPLTPEAAQWASVLDAGAVLSFLSAGTWWELPVESDGRIHVTVPGRRRTVTARGVRVHRVALAEAAVTARFGMPITTRTETVLDCLGFLRLAEASRLADRALQQGWISQGDLAARLTNQRGRWGNGQLARLLRQSDPGAAAESERRLLRLLRQAGIVGWQINHPIVVGSATYYGDLVLLDHRLVLEVDGWAYHSDVDRFRHDRRRQNALVASGWTVLRFT
jgi:very-short-patch-repair endonuclease